MVLCIVFEMWSFVDLTIAFGSVSKEASTKLQYVHRVTIFEPFESRGILLAMVV